MKNFIDRQLHDAVMVNVEGNDDAPVVKASTAYVSKMVDGKPERTVIDGVFFDRSIFEVKVEGDESPVIDTVKSTGKNTQLKFNFSTEDMSSHTSEWLDLVMQTILNNEARRREAAQKIADERGDGLYVAIYDYHTDYLLLPGRAGTMIVQYRHANDANIVFGEKLFDIS